MPRRIDGLSPLWKYGFADCQPTLKSSAIACRLSRVGYRAYHDSPCLSFFPTLVVFLCIKHFRRFQQSVLAYYYTLNFIVCQLCWLPSVKIEAKGYSRGNAEINRVLASGKTPKTTARYLRPLVKGYNSQKLHKRFVQPVQYSIRNHAVSNIDYRLYFACFF